MKICVIGFSGSGKSSLTKKLAKIHNIPALHLDSLNFHSNWVVRDREELNNLLIDFLNNNTSWIIDGTYTKIAPIRFLQADLIIYLKFNRFTCLYRVIKRYFQYKNKTREDMASGCNEKIDMEFLKWVFYKGRNKQKKAKINDIIKDKNVIILKNQKHINKFLKDNY